MHTCTKNASELQVKMSLRPKPLKRSTRGWMLLPYKSDMQIEGRQLVYKDKADARRHKTKSQVLVPVTLTQRYKYD